MKQNAVNERNLSKEKQEIKQNGRRKLRVNWKTIYKFAEGIFVS